MDERLTEFRDGIWGLSLKAIKQGYDRYSVYSRLAAYEDSSMSPEEIKEVQDALNPIPFGRFHEIMQAERDGHLAVLPCKVGELMEKYRELTESEGADEAETYTTGYRNGHRNGQAELIAYLLQIDTGTRGVAEKAISEVGE